MEIFRLDPLDVVNPSRQSHLWAVQERCQAFVEGLAFHDPPCHKWAIGNIPSVGLTTNEGDPPSKCPPSPQPLGTPFMGLLPLQSSRD